VVSLQTFMQPWHRRTHVLRKVMRESPESRRLVLWLASCGIIERSTHFKFILNATFLMAISPVIKAACRTRWIGCGVDDVFWRA